MCGMPLFSQSSSLAIKPAARPVACLGSEVCGMPAMFYRDVHAGPVDPCRGQRAWRSRVQPNIYRGDFVQQPYLDAHRLSFEGRINPSVFSRSHDCIQGVASRSFAPGLWYQCAARRKHGRNQSTNHLRAGGQAYTAPKHQQQAIGGCQRTLVNPCTR